MAQTDALKKYLDAGMAFTQLTRKRAEQVVKDLVAAGELQRNQAKDAIDDLVERSRKNTDALAEQVRKEVDSQLSAMGLARKADVERLEAELASMKGSDSGSAKAGAGDDAKKGESSESAPLSMETPAKKAAAKKAPAKPQVAKDASAKEPPSNETPAKKAAAKQSASKEDAPADKPAKKVPAKKVPAKKAPSKAAAERPDMSMPAKKAAKASKKSG